MSKEVIQAKNIGTIYAPISLGEVVDKITILEIKSSKLTGKAQANTNKELAALKECLASIDAPISDQAMDALRAVNRSLWETEDRIREKERNKDFGEEFIELARSVYKQNDKRAALKKSINTEHGSALVEEKSYKDY